MYAFQLFARAANEPRLYAKEILDLEDYISLKHNCINFIVFDPNVSTTKSLIFYIDFIYQNILYNVKANVIPDFLSYISISVEIQKDGNFIKDEAIIREVDCNLYEALIFLV